MKTEVYLWECKFVKTFENFRLKFNAQIQQ